MPLHTKKNHFSTKIICQFSQNGARSKPAQRTGPADPQTRLLTLARRNAVPFNLPPTYPDLAFKNASLQDGRKMSSHGAVTRNYTTALFRREAKTFERFKKTCRQNGDCLGCYYGNCQSTSKLPDVAMTTKDNVNLCHNLSVNTMAPFFFFCFCCHTSYHTTTYRAMN